MFPDVCSLGLCISFASFVSFLPFASSNALFALPKSVSRWRSASPCLAERLLIFDNVSATASDVATRLLMVKHAPLPQSENNCGVTLLFSTFGLSHFCFKVRKNETESTPHWNTRQPIAIKADASSNQCVKTDTENLEQIFV